MKKSAREFVTMVAALILAFGIGASITKMPVRAQERNHPDSERGEHGRTEGRSEHRESGEGAKSEHGKEGEESGVRIGRDETWDATRNGARLVLAFDAASNAFVGKVENTT